MQDAESLANIKSCLMVIMLLAFAQNAQSEATPFHENHHYQPVWTSPIARHELLQAINELADDGLNPADYHQEALRDIIHRSAVDASQTLPEGLDLIFTDAFLLLAAHLRDGKVDSQTIQAQWLSQKRQPLLQSTLEQALQDETVYQTLQSFKPPFPAYQKLRNYRRQLSGLLGCTSQGRPYTRATVTHVYPRFASSSGCWATFRPPTTTPITVPSTSPKASFMRAT